MCRACTVGVGARVIRPGMRSGAPVAWMTWHQPPGGLPMISHSRCSRDSMIRCAVVFITAGTAAMFASTANADPWGQGLPFDGIITGHEADGTPLYSCSTTFIGHAWVGKTRAGWGFCDIGIAWVD